MYHLSACSSKLPELVNDELGWSESKWVLATDGKDWQVAKYCVYPDLEDKAKWVVFGPDGYEFDGVTHWIPLPPGQRTLDRHPNDRH